MTLIKCKHVTYYHDGERLLKKRVKKERKKKVEYFITYLKAPLDRAIEYVKEIEQTEELQIDF